MTQITTDVRHADRGRRERAPSTAESGASPTTRRRQGRRPALAHGAGHLVAARHRAAALGAHVVVQDQLGDLRVAVRAAAEAGTSTTTVNAWTTAGIGSFFFNSVIVVFGALILTMLFGSMSAYVLARFTFPGSRLLYYLMLAGLTFPIFLAIVPLFFVLRGIGLLNTLPGLILTYAAFAFPFTVFFLYAFFRTLSKSIAEAAAMDGAGEWRTFFQIMLPMARPGLATVAILNFVGLWNQFLLPVALNTNPENYVLTQGMASFASQAGYSVDFGALFAAVVITVVPVLIVYLIFQRQLQGSVSQGTNK